MSVHYKADKSNYKAEKSQKYNTNWEFWINITSCEFHGSRANHHFYVVLAKNNFNLIIRQHQRNLNLGNFIKCVANSLQRIHFIRDKAKQTKEQSPIRGWQGAAATEGSVLTSAGSQTVKATLARKLVRSDGPSLTLLLPPYKWPGFNHCTVVLYWLILQKVMPSVAECLEEPGSLAGLGCPQNNTKLPTVQFPALKANKLKGKQGWRELMRTCILIPRTEKSRTW